MSRITLMFDRLNDEGRKAFIPFITTGDPDVGFTLRLMHHMVEKGADLIELGIPFSDPMADGPAIQLANERALSKGIKLRDVLNVVAEFRKTNNDTPVVLMGYMNPIEMMGTSVFAEIASHSGVDGVLCVDLPPEENSDLNVQLRQRGIDNIYLLSPTTSEDRARAICHACTGYIYYVSLKGVTGSAELDTQEVRERIEFLRTLTDLPIAVGFGIRNGETAAAISQVADGVVVGSAMVNLIAENQSTPDVALQQIGDLVSGIRVAIDQAQESLHSSEVNT